MAQANKTCPYCLAVGHSGFYCPKKPVKPIKSRSKQLKAVKMVSKSKKKETRSQVVKKLDKIFSEYVRLRDDGNGCITCGTVKPWKEMQACHYYSRGKLPTRWHEDNVHSGCYRCNVLLKGNYTEYAIYMVNGYGIDYVKELRELAYSSVKIPTAELRDKIEHYSTEVKRLKSVKGIANYA